MPFCGRLKQSVILSLLVASTLTLSLPLVGRGNRREGV